MSAPVRFTLDGRAAAAEPGETLWEAAARLGTDIPHLCHMPQRGYRPDGNCRACMVEIEGERTLAASCIRKPTEGMAVRTGSPRAVAARAMVMELLLADQPARAGAHDPDSELWRQAEAVGRAASRFPARAAAPAADPSHPAMAVNLDACIHCTRCVRACREVQVNDVIGMAGRGARAQIVFDMADPMGESTCVACGECVQACPTGALLPATDATTKADRAVDSLCPWCGVGCQLTFHVKDNRIMRATGRDGPANHARLCVKGRFGFDYARHPDRLTVPLVRKPGAAKRPGDIVDPANPWTHFRKAGWDEALDLAAGGFARIRETRGGAALAGFGSAKGSNEEAYLVQKLVRTGFRTNNVDHCTRLCHASSVAALMETIGSGAVTAPVSEAANADVIMVVGANPAENHPVAATFIKNAAKRGARLIVADPRGQALKRHATWMLQPRPGSDVAMLNALLHVIVAERLHDARYVAAHTEGFEALAAHVADYAPEAMEKECGIPRGHAARGGPRLGWRRPRHGLLGHGDLAACPRHRQRALPHRPRAAVRPCRPSGHRAASAARPEQRAGRLRRRPDPDGLSRLPSRRRPGGAAALRVAVGRAARPRPRPHRGRNRRRRLRRAHRGPLRHGREPGHVRPGRRARARRAVPTRPSGGAGHFPHRNCLVCRRDPAGERLPGENGEFHQYRPPRADRTPGARPARRCAPGLVDIAGTRAPPRPRLETMPAPPTSTPRCAPPCRPSPESRGSAWNARTR